MMFGGHGSGGAAPPRVVQVRVQRQQQTAPRAGSPSNFLVSIHEEASVITWQCAITVAPEVEARLVGAVAELHTWSLGLGPSADNAAKQARDLGRRLRDVFLGDQGLAVLDALHPTVLLLEIDETILGLPWELLYDPDDRPYAITIPTGRVVTTRSAPVARRDSLADDAEVTILVIAPEAADLAAVDEEVHAIEAMATTNGTPRVTVDVLRGADATNKGLADAIAGRSIEIVHVASHGRFDANAGSLRLGDGWFDAAHVAGLEWKDAPYLLFGSACESARAMPGRRLLSRGKASGLASAFLAAGVEAYLGYFWPVGDVNAALFARTFYETLFGAKNVGQAVYEARRAVSGAFEERVDLTAVGAVFFGDSGTAERADLATAV